jgi:DNA helicase-2/ATP-dependent DNA helicase PcrA
MSDAYATRYKALNAAQKKAVDTIDGPVMVIAGPGSGKTELLSLRVGTILKEGTARASNILLLTFTETAARNMRERLETLIGPDAFRVAIYTFHGFCTDIMERFPEYFWNGSHYKPASDLVQSEILESIFKRLPHKHILSSFHPEMGYSYLKEAQIRIKDIKKGGLTPDRFRDLLEENEKSFDALNKILQKDLPERVGKDSIEAFERMKEAFEKEGSNLALMYAKSVEHALADAGEEEKTTPLSTWKTDYTGKDESGTRVLKDTLQLPKLYALCDIYADYQKALHAEGYFDYEDMILQVVGELERNVTLRTELEEQYQYVMVDEFQDTNNAQLSLVKAISSNPVHEGHPNVCVVGDDDQAIYKFQGAEISNIHSFRELYKDVEVIVLTENYRSTPKILDFARAVVLQGVNRLETRYKEIRKDLVAKNKSLPAGRLCTFSFASEEEEYTYIAKEIETLLAQGVEASEIALIAREHKQLKTILPYLGTKDVPYSYERNENVFDERHVQELVTLCRFLSTVGDNAFERDDLLPQILSFPFWGLDRVSIWRIAEHAKGKNVTWLEAMRSSDDAKVRELADFLLEVGVASQTAPLEIVLDTLIGSKDLPLVKESQDDDDDFTLPSLSLATTFTSPYKEFYFGKDALAKNSASYIHFLSSLKVFVGALREYKDGATLRAYDVGEFVDLYIAYNLSLPNKTSFATNENSVQLLTSHGAKGLEFEYVFIVSVNDSVWAGRPKGSKISFPINLPLASAGDTEDDFIRLFYVALTRARHSVYLTHHKSPLRFLQSPDLPETETKLPHVAEPDMIATGLQVYQAPPFAKDEKALLVKVVEGYQLSPTHLNNFLNIIDGGPMRFLEQNLLRFPQAKTPSSVYGTAIHKALEDAHIMVKKDGKLPPLEKILDSFRRELRRGRLLDYEEENKRKRGEKILERYYELRKDDIRAEHLVELNFAHQGVELGGALLTGKIDKIVEEDGMWTVIDLKTGKGFSSFEEEKLSSYDELKLHQYRNQLMMYKILVEHSRDHSSHKVGKGVLEFVEEEAGGKIQEIVLPFEGMHDELARFKSLASAVYRKIVNLDLLLDVSRYEKTLAGIQEFEDDLIAGRI